MIIRIVFWLLLQFMALQGSSSQRIGAVGFSLSLLGLALCEPGSFSTSILRLLAPRQLALNLSFFSLPKVSCENVR